MATKYGVLTRAFFSRHGIADYRIVVSESATEGAPAAGAAELQQWRAELVAALQGAGLRPIAGHAPFVLVDVGVGVRETLRDKGFAVRTGASFPGLGPSWIRIAVRDPGTTASFIEALTSIDKQETSA